uniref:Uncharacterized protein n=1 Tax=Arundo donax TaxID=35708 RepID=A0A0A9ASC3_ARUDO
MCSRSLNDCKIEPISFVEYRQKEQILSRILQSLLCSLRICLFHILWIRFLDLKSFHSAINMLTSISSDYLRTSGLITIHNSFSRNLQHL